MESMVPVHIGFVSDLEKQQKARLVDETKAKLTTADPEKEPIFESSLGNDQAQQSTPSSEVQPTTHEVSQTSQQAVSGVNRPTIHKACAHDDSSDEDKQKTINQKGPKLWVDRALSLFAGRDVSNNKNASFSQPPTTHRQTRTRTGPSQDNIQIPSRADYNKLRREYLKVKDSHRQLEDDLLGERIRVRQLEDDIREQEHVITKAHTNAIGLLSRDVSNDLPDDRIRREFQAFFDQDALGWCMDHRRTEQIDEPHASELLVKEGILADSSTVPDHLKISMQGDAASAVLLQAALARALCEYFLADPFFLQDWLPRPDHQALRSAFPED
ncbi:hypothetical protein QQX98_002480 [Neonectria punicea]|uniref:Uncharacterized protein n=1 Tax=Neonectria punicea TaxID=979145 RepID=A0ABR1HK58_9HYPO